MQSVHKEVHYEFGVALDRNLLVEEAVVVLKHTLAKFFDFDKDLRQRHSARLELAAVAPDDAHHFVDLEPNKRQQIRCPSLARSF